MALAVRADIGAFEPDLSTVRALATRLVGEQIREVDFRDAGVDERLQLAGLRDAVLVAIAPDAQPREHGVATVDRPALIDVILRKREKAVGERLGSRVRRGQRARILAEE